MKKSLKLGVTYSSELIKELKNENLRKYIDTIELSDLFNVYKLEKPWTYHFRRSLNGEPITLLDSEPIKQTLSSEYVKKILEDKKPEIISLHLGFPAKQIGTVPPDNHNYAFEIVREDEAIKQFSETLNYLTESLEIPVAVENLDYHRTGAYEYVCNPKFINEIFKKNDELYLLLDIAHAEISAVELLHTAPQYRLEATKEYLSNLPLDRVIEIHINSPTWKNNLSLDMHLPITNIELSLLEELLDLPNLEVINLECNQRISQQVMELYELIKK